MRRYVGEQRRQWRDELEQSAISRLRRHFADRGSGLEILATRPDEANRRLPNVDFEVRYQGRTIGVEVTQLIPAGRSHYEVAMADQHLKAALESIPSERGLGLILIELDYRSAPAARQLEVDVLRLEQRLRDALMSAAPDSREPVDVTLDAENASYARVRIRRLGSEEDRLVLMSGAEDWGGNLDRQATQFVADLLNKKPRQTAAWAEAWIVILDRVGLVGPDLISDALAQRSGDIPPNWSHIFFLPAPSEGPITALTRELGFAIRSSDHAD